MDPIVGVVALSAVFFTAFVVLAVASERITEDLAAATHRLTKR